MTRPDQPDAPLTHVTEHGNGQVILHIVCPHCGRAHSHGGGRDLSIARDFLGHRASSCTALHGYVLTDPDGLLP